MSIQLRAAKKQRVADLVPGSDDRYQRKIWQEHPEPQHQFILLWNLEKSKAIALLDYQWLGEKLVGAPDNDNDSLCIALWDEEDCQPYPVKVIYVPHWIKTLKTISIPDYLAWVFLEACEYETLPVSPEGIEWKNWIVVQPVWLEQHQVLKRFKKPKTPIIYPAHIQRTIERVKWLNNPVSIDSIEFNVPVNLPCLNWHIWEWRPVSTREEGKQIDKQFMKRYLEGRAIKWLAVGGFHQW